MATRQSNGKVFARTLEEAERKQIENAQRPDPRWVRGECPKCGEDLVANLYYVGGKGYLLVWECWGSLAEKPTCVYRRVL